MDFYGVKAHCVNSPVEPGGVHERDVVDDQQNTLFMGYRCQKNENQATEIPREVILSRQSLSRFQCPGCLGRFNSVERLKVHCYLLHSSAVYPEPEKAEVIENENWSDQLDKIFPKVDMYESSYEDFLAGGLDRSSLKRAYGPVVPIQSAIRDLPEAGPHEFKAAAGQDSGIGFTSGSGEICTDPLREEHGDNHSQNDGSGPLDLTVNSQDRRVRAPSLPVKPQGEYKAEQAVEWIDVSDIVRDLAAVVGIDFDDIDDCLKRIPVIHQKTSEPSLKSQSSAMTEPQKIVFFEGNNLFLQNQKIPFQTYFSPVGNGEVVPEVGESMTAFSKGKIRSNKISPELRDSILEVLNKGPKSHGYGGDKWKPEQISEILRMVFHLDYKPTSIQKFLTIHLGITLTELNKRIQVK